jgi:hypothetical protein
MSRTTSSTPTTTTPSDEQVVAMLSTSLEAARAELAALEPRREALVARVQSLETTLAVFKGEPVPHAPKRRASKRRAATAGATPVEGGDSVRAKRAAKAAAKPAPANGDTAAA